MKGYEKRLQNIEANQQQIIEKLSYLENNDRMLSESIKGTFTLIQQLIQISLLDLL
jgi:hypothetical protein